MDNDWDHCSCSSSDRELAGDWEHVDTLTESSSSTAGQRPDYPQDKSQQTVASRPRVRCTYADSEIEKRLDLELGVDMNKCRQRAAAPLPAVSLGQLHACYACKSYHYISECVYTISWSEYIDYHARYLSSLPMSRYDALSYPTRDLSPEDVRERAEWLDGLPNNRANYLPLTRLKSDIMTTSAKNAYWDENEWCFDLQPGSKYQIAKDHMLRAWRNAGQESSAATSWSAGDTDSRTGSAWDERALADVRTAFGRHLPATSLASPFRA